MQQAVLATFARCEVKDGEVKMPTEEDYARIRENLEQNVIETAKKNPEVTFYYFIPPYSAYFWDATIRSNEFDFVLETERYAMELLTEVPNIRLYSFSTESDITCNPEKYMDTHHYYGDGGKAPAETFGGEEEQCPDDDEDGGADTYPGVGVDRFGLAFHGVT